MLPVVGAEFTAVGGDQFHGQQVVAGQPVLAFQPPRTATQGETADPGGRHPAAGGGQSMGLGRGVELTPGTAATDPGDRATGSISIDFIGRTSITSPSSLLD